MGEFKSRCVFNKERKSLYGWRSVRNGLSVQFSSRKMLTFQFIGKYWKKRHSPSSWRWKIFWNFGFNRMGIRPTRLIWPWIWLKLTSRSTSFQTVFHSKKRGAGAGRRTAQISDLWTISLGLCKGPVLRKQTNNDFGSVKKYYRYFWLASRGSGHFLVGYPELPEVFGASCGEGGWTHRKCYNLSCLTRVLLLNFVHSTIFKNCFHRELLFWKTLYKMYQYVVCT